MMDPLRCFFCRTRIPSNPRYAKSIMITSIKSQYPAFTPDKPLCQMCYARAYHQLKRLFNKKKEIDSAMSTTSISDAISTSGSLNVHSNETDSESRNSQSSTQQSEDIPIQQQERQPLSQSSAASGEEFIPRVASNTTSDDVPIQNSYILREYETDDEDAPSSIDEPQVTQPIVRRRKKPVTFVNERIVPIFNQISSFGG